MRKHYRARY